MCQKNERQKLDFKSQKCMFLGYPDTRKGYRLYDVQKLKIVYSRDVIFNETEFFNYKEKEKDQPLVCINLREEQVEETEETVNGENEDETINEEETDDTHREEGNTEEQEGSAIQRRSTRIKRRPYFYGSFINLTHNTHVAEPTTVNEVLSSDSHKWKEAMNAKMKSLYDNDAWKLVEAPETGHVVNCKWIFKCKVDERGQIECHKAHLVARGYCQRPGLDYNETF
uniref:Uncharacterized protein n=1 Tax=Amphimedon queenslandica TaxID=400682 RepID=A0A1X7V641_AMPQE